MATTHTSRHSRKGILKGANSRANLAMFGVTLLTFELTATIQLNLYSNFEVSIVYRAAVASRQAIRFSMVILWPQLINVWRVWVLYSPRKYIRTSLVVLWVITALLGLEGHCWCMAKQVLFFLFSSNCTHASTIDYVLKKCSTVYLVSNSYYFWESSSNSSPSPTIVLSGFNTTIVFVNGSVTKQI
ncbi:hypothetical protein C8R44DRAFT_740490 [Mycena epipterygia]|nr:hypothetical protein C8R44DRAFT_740490 [Mycena epipterygia]